MHAGIVADGHDPRDCSVRRIGRQLFLFDQPLELLDDTILARLSTRDVHIGQKHLIACLR